MIGTTEVPRTLLTTSKTLIQNTSEIINKYSSYATGIPKNSYFYSDVIMDEKYYYSYNDDRTVVSDKNGKVINVYDGYSVPEIAYKVQENIKNSISSMLDVNIDTINVHVQGVDFSQKAD